jgi:4-hydroxyphenylacetate 3-monooxygenase
VNGWPERTIIASSYTASEALASTMPAGSEQTTRFIQEKLALLACYREGINAHLTAAVAMAEESPGGLLTPNQSLL